MEKNRATLFFHGEDRELETRGVSALSFNEIKGPAGQQQFPETPWIGKIGGDLPPVSLADYGKAVGTGKKGGFKK